MHRRAQTHAVRRASKTGQKLALCGGVDSLADMLRLAFILMVVPGANRGIDEAAEEKDKADKKYDTGHATVKSMSFSHTGCLTHNGSFRNTRFPGDSDINAHSFSQVN